MNTLLDRVDLNTILDRVDVDALMARADIDAIMDRVDVQALVERAGVPAMVAESTSHLGASALDLVRRPIVGLDEIVFRILNGLLRRDISEFPDSPGELGTWADERAEEDAVKTGRYAGPLTRLLAVIADSFIVATGFTLIMAGLAFLIGLFVEGDVSIDANRGIWAALVFLSWAFLYYWISLAVFGKTIGKAILGVRVVGSDGTIAVGGRQAFVRTLTYPLSFLMFGLGLLGVVFGRERRAWHDHLAGSAVVYDWGSRTAQMPTPLAEFLDKRSEDDESGAGARVVADSSSPDESAPDESDDGDDEAESEPPPVDA